MTTENLWANPHHHREFAANGSATRVVGFAPRRPYTEVTAAGSIDRAAMGLTHTDLRYTAVVKALLADLYESYGKQKHRRRVNLPLIHFAIDCC